VALLAHSLAKIKFFGRKPRKNPEIWENWTKIRKKEANFRIE
jgi:hypothetical protein